MKGVLYENIKRKMLIFVAVLVVSIFTIVPAVSALSTYSYWGYYPSSGAHGLCQSKPDGTESLHPMRWWPAAGYNMAMTYYKLGSSLDSSFITACTNAEANWESVWGNNSQMFFFTRDASAVTDAYNRAIGMSALGPGTFGEVFLTDPDHPWKYSSRVSRYVHDINKWYMRFQSSMTNSVMPNGKGGHWSWGSGSAQWIADRESITTHEFGHVIGLFHPGQLENDAQTMWAYANAANGDRTGTYARTPSSTDAFAFSKLYPNPIK